MNEPCFICGDGENGQYCQECIAEIREAELDIAAGRTVPLEDVAKGLWPCT
jgi:hypothetical protein